MKKLIIILLAVVPGFAFAQQKETASDSSWIANRNGIFYQIRAVVYANGEENTTAVPLGDTIQTVQKFRDNIRNAASTFASDAQIVSGYRRQITELIRFGRTLPAILGKSPLDSLRADQSNLLIASGWTLRTDGTNTGIRFRVTLLGAFQWKADTTTTWRSAFYLVGVIRLNGMNGYATDFFKNSKGGWTTISQQYSIWPPGNESRLISADLPEEQLAATDHLPKTELLTGGVVRIGELQYKYNGRIKKWVQL
jgi:hypothetical protein